MAAGSKHDWTIRLLESRLKSYETDNGSAARLAALREDVATIEAEIANAAKIAAGIRESILVLKSEASR